MNETKPQSALDPDRIEAAGWLLVDLMSRGVTFTMEGDQATYHSPAKLSDWDKELLRELRPEILAALGRSSALPTCPRCQGRLLEQFTIDGFANIVCPPCQHSFGCYPVSADAIERFGDRGYQAIEIFRVACGTPGAFNE